MLTLPIKKKWFDMILNGEKKEEYREIKPYYTSRWNNAYREVKNSHSNVDFLHVVLRNGYSKDSPYIKVRCALSIGYGREKWGAEKNKLYYVLKILDILEIGNIQGIKCIPDTANVFKTLRESRKWSVKELGEKLDVSESYIYLIENNKKYPSKTLIEKYCQVFDISLRTFLLFEEMTISGRKHIAY